MRGILLGPDWRSRRIGVPRLIVLALCSAALLAGVEFWDQNTQEPQSAAMLTAARAMAAASQVLRAEKEERGLLQGTDLDPNRTGMVGPEYTPITTTVGDLQSKRTATNPDLAAVLVKRIARLRLPPGTPVVVVTSGSFIGGNVAALAAVEALALKPIVVASLSASMYGATDPEMNWADMAGLLRRRGVIATPIAWAVLGGENGGGRGIDGEGARALRASAAKEGISIAEGATLGDIVDTLVGAIAAALPKGRSPGLLINVGGALVSLGNCRESYSVQPGIHDPPATCTQGVPGVVLRLSNRKIPLLHLINFRRLAAEFDLPFDPIPLPPVGGSRKIYGPVH